MLPSADNTMKLKKLYNAYFDPYISFVFTSMRFAYTVVGYLCRVIGVQPLNPSVCRWRIGKALVSMKCPTPCT